MYVLKVFICSNSCFTCLQKNNMNVHWFQGGLQSRCESMYSYTFTYIAIYVCAPEWET